ncbi:homocysteine S-methyltransferase family protein [Novosphingobium aquimarinum]|uniref:homocysteine S-methyltransferase family protein n=1 Tax=Novosphingobium aquimarinum TaxID=2682494 RepID=UPI0012EC6248|nr:homocysteine S-methyltransferase family protein [Novosphingobium aquimarinum]
MKPVQRLLQSRTPFLTDGGLETWLFFQQGFSAPEFAALTLIRDDAAREAMERYFEGFLAIAEAEGRGFVLDTCTWRGCTTWAERLGMSREALLDLSREAAQFAGGLRDRWQERLPAIVMNGVIGPAGDGYSADSVPTAEAAQELHRPQIATLAQAGVDMISAITMTSIGEATGIARAATDAGLPCVISFTVETDGRLPSGDALGEAIVAVDDATGASPAYYMINCAHPDHFGEVLNAEEPWVERIGGLRANASRLSHEELDNSEVLDEGDPAEFGRLHRDLASKLPGLKVIGGCCGTDHRHVGCAAKSLPKLMAA